jgi:hypothetical protein
MFYRTSNETITKKVDDKFISTYVHKKRKSTEYGRLNYLIEAELIRNDISLYYKHGSLNVVAEIFNRAPMYLNFLSLRGYKNILFVGHYNSGAQKYWHHPAKSDYVVHQQPPERSAQERVADFNLIMQFLPVVRMAYGYTSFNMHVLQPPEWRHRHIVHALYNRYGVDLLPVNKQYKHGMSSLDITPPPEFKYDAVVFAGVPKEYDDTTFDISDVRKTFEPYCVKGFDIVDLYYQDKDNGKYIGGYTKDITTELTAVFTNRSFWDDRMNSYRPETKEIEYNLMKDMVSVY